MCRKAEILTYQMSQSGIRRLIYTDRHRQRAATREFLRFPDLDAYFMPINYDSLTE
jgi:hypothetical protein